MKTIILFLVSLTVLGEEPEHQRVFVGHGFKLNIVNSSYGVYTYLTIAPKTLGQWDGAIVELGYKTTHINLLGPNWDINSSWQIVCHNPGMNCEKANVALEWITSVRVMFYRNLGGPMALLESKLK